MANKKTKKKSNSYWMRYGGSPKKMKRYHEGGFTHPHPHPKDASDEILQGAQTWKSYTDGDGNALNKRETYNWEDDVSANVNAFKNSKWFNHFPDTLKNVPKTVKDLNAYEEAIGAQRTRTIQLHDTDFTWDDPTTYGGGLAAMWAASNVANSVPTPWTQAVGWGMKGIGGLVVAGKAYNDYSKRQENEELKKANPYATFVDGSGNILNYEDGNGMFFDLFHPSKENSVTMNKDVRESPPKQILNEDQKTKKITFEMGGNTTPNQNTQDDPTFKMWFAKNARREDVMQSSGNIDALKKLFLNDINFPGNNMPVFSGELDAFGNVDKSNRSMDLSEQMIGGMGMKYGGMPMGMGKIPAKSMPVAYKGLPKAELGMGQGLYKSPTDATRDYSDVANINGNFKQKIGDVGEKGYLKAFNYVVPGLGTVLDSAADWIGFSGDKKQHRDNTTAASEANNMGRNLQKDGANKDTLDLSTRTDALSAIGSYNEEAPSFMKDLAPELIGNAKSLVGDVGKIGNFFGNTGAPTGEIGDFVPPVELPGGDLMAKYGGSMGMKRPMRMMGGANNFQPGHLDAMTAAAIGGQFNPLSPGSQFESQGMNQQSFNQGGDPGMEEYEAEGGEAIMHPPGEIPVTTGNTEQVDGDMNDSMVSMLEGNSHETMDKDGHTGEIVQNAEGQYVFSKSLKSKTWQMNFADAAEKIGKNIKRFKKEMETGDSITQSTAASMIESWNKQLTTLQQEQEGARQVKFMDLMNSGANEQELMEKFPDIYQQFQAEQQEAQLSEAAAQSIAGPTGAMQDNPMGNIDMSQLSADEQQLVGAKYGLPQKETGGPIDYDFNRYFGEAMGNNEFESFGLDNNYMPDKKGLMSYLTANYPDEGFTLGENTYTSPKDMYGALLEGFTSSRNEKLTAAGIPTSRPSGDDYKVDVEQLNPATGEMETSWDWIEGGKQKMKTDRAKYKVNNMGLPYGFDENFGADANLSKRQYFKAMEASYAADGKTKDEIKSLIARDKIKYDENSLLQNSQETPLSAEDQAAALAEKLASGARNKKILDGVTSGLNTLATLAPTAYNFSKGNEAAEVDPFNANPNEALLKENMERLSNPIDIQRLLDENEENFNSLKYVARDASDGSSGSMMNTLLRGQNNQDNADLKAFGMQAEAELKGLQIQNEGLFNMGERDRSEANLTEENNAQNRAAKEAFKAKGWEGLSGFSQLQEKMANEMANDKQLVGLLSQIYPDAELYMKRDGTMDMQKLIQSGDMEKLIEKYPQFKSLIEKYIK